MSLSSVIRYVEVKDSTATDGSGLTGKVFGDFTAKYLVQGGTLTSLTTETITTLGTFQAPSDASHLRIKELNSAAPTKGIYEVHFHDTQVANTGKKLWLFLSVTGGVPVRFEMDLLPYAGGNATNSDNLDSAASNYSATRGLTGTALPAVASGNAGAVITAGSSTAQLNVSSGKAPVTLASTDVSGNVAADLQTIKTQAVTCSGGVTVPAATLASTTNITAATGITVSTNSDKTGYSLTQSFPSNFSALAITAGGIVQSDLQTIKTQSVTCAAGVTINVNVGATQPFNFTGTGASALVKVDTIDIGGQTATLTAGAPDVNVVSVTDTVDFTTTMKTSLNSATPAVTVSDKTGFSLTSAYDFAKGTVALTESYAADGVAPTPEQFFFQIWSLLAERNFVSTTLTTKKLDGSTTAMTFTLDDATTPTTQTRST